MRLISGLVSKPARASTDLLGGILRAEAGAVVRVARIALSAGGMIRENLSMQRSRTVPDPLAPMPGSLLSEEPLLDRASGVAARGVPTSNGSASDQLTPGVAPLRRGDPSPRIEPSPPSRSRRSRQTRPARSSARGGGSRETDAGRESEEGASATSTSPSPAPSGASEATPGSPAPASPVELTGNGHVDEDVVLVSESSDSGAEDGAGAVVHVQEPWEGYRSMRAREIVDHLAAAPEAELSLVMLYEAKAGRPRQTVLKAAELELSRRTTPA